ncbi:MAG: LysR substrate-binding domain-containing protein [Rhodocyclaceae bacterium]
MDKLRAIQYLVAAVEAGSLAGAARQLDVSVPAVQKLIGALEHTLGTTLLERNAQGVRPTVAGGEYLDCCRPLLAELSAAEDAIKLAATRPSGTLAIAVHEQLAHHVLLPALPRFRARFPDIQLDFRTVHRISDADAQSAEVLLLHGWPEATQDFVHRRMDMTRTLIVASPEYWAARGIPGDPADLANHECLTIRNPAGIVIDLWEFLRGDEKRSVKVNGWLITNAREVLIDCLLRSQGVARVIETTSRTYLQSGRLIPVLLDWAVQGGPPTNLLYRASARRNPRARLFIEFVTQLLLQHDAEGKFLAQQPSGERPAWHRRGYSRASAAIRIPD